MENRVRKQKNQSYHKLGNQMGQQVMYQDPAAGFPQLAGYGYILPGTKLQNLTPDQTCKAAPVCSRNPGQQPL